MASFSWWMREPEVIMNRFRQCWPMAGRVLSAFAVASSVAAAGVFLAGRALASASHPDRAWSAQKQASKIASSRSRGMPPTGAAAAARSGTARHDTYVIVGDEAGATGRAR
jgi:hypothetical protein